MPGPAAAGPAAQQKTLIATEQDPLARAQWTDATADWATERVIFLDETSTQIVMTRTRGRARRGEFDYDLTPTGAAVSALLFVAITLPIQQSS